MKRGFISQPLLIGLAVIAALSALLWAANAFVSSVEMRGYDRGVAEQKAADQIQFDAINAERAQQKAEAAKAYQAAQAKVVALLRQRDEFKTKLTQERQDNEASTAALRDQLAGVGLRFRAQGPGDRACGAGPGSPEGNTAGPAQAPVVQLPEALTRDLRQLAFDADQLKNEYALCYGWATGGQ